MRLGRRHHTTTARLLSAAARGLWDSPHAQPRQGRPAGRSGSTRRSLRRGGSLLRHQQAVFRRGRHHTSSQRGGGLAPALSRSESHLDLPLGFTASQTSSCVTSRKRYRLCRHPCTCDTGALRPVGDPRGAYAKKANCSSCHFGAVIVLAYLCSPTRREERLNKARPARPPLGVQPRRGPGSCCGPACCGTARCWARS